MSTEEGPKGEGSAEGEANVPPEKKKRLKKKEKYGTYDKGFEYDLANLETQEVGQHLYNARGIVDRWIEEQDDTPFKDLLSPEALQDAVSMSKPPQLTFEGPEYEEMAVEFYKWQEDMLRSSGGEGFDAVVEDFGKFAEKMVEKYGEAGQTWSAEMKRQFEEHKKMMEEEEGYRKGMVEEHGEEAIKKMEEEMRGAQEQKEKESKGPRLRWETRVVLDPGAAWHPANRKVKMSVYVWELVRDVPLDDRQRRHLIDLVGKRYNANKDEITITTERYRYREENRKDCLRTLYALLDEVKLPSVELVHEQKVSQG